MLTFENLVHVYVLEKGKRRFRRNSVPRDELPTPQEAVPTPAAEKPPLCSTVSSFFTRLPQNIFIFPARSDGSARIQNVWIGTEVAFRVASFPDPGSHELATVPRMTFDPLG